MNKLRRMMPWKLTEKNDVFILELFEGTLYPRTSPILPNIDSVLRWLDKRSIEFAPLEEVEPYAMSGNLESDKIDLSDCCNKIKEDIKNGERNG